MASPSNADGGSSVGGGGSESRIRYEIEQGSSLLSQHDKQHTGGGGSFSSRNFNDDDDDDDDDDGAINNSDNPCPTKGRRSPFLNGGGEQHDSYSAERERQMEQGLLQGRQGEDHQRLDDDPHKDGLGNGRGIGGNEYEEEAEGSWAALHQTYNDSPPIPEETQSDLDSGGGGGGKRSFSRHRSPHQDDDLDAGQQTQHRDPPGRMMGGAPDQEAEDEDETVVVTGGGGGGGDGERQRQRHSSPSIEKTSRFKQQQRQQPQRPGFLSPGKNRRPLRPGFHEEACTSEDEEGEGADEDVTSSHGHGRGGGGGGGRENSVETPSRFEPRGGGEQSGASAFSESDADDASNGTWASSKAGQGSNIHTREEGEGGEDGEEEEEEEEAGAEGRAQKRQRQQRRKHSEMLVGNGFSAIARCYEAANHAIRGVEANQRNMLEAETEIREDLVTFGVRVKEATHLMQMQLAAAFTEDGLGPSGT